MKGQSPESIPNCEDIAFRRPWGCRILTPLLASILPFSLTKSFLALSFFSHWLSLILLYGLLRKLGRSFSSSIIGMLFYTGVFWVMKWSFYSPFYIDFQTQMFILAILYLMVIKEYHFIPLLIAAGILQKETILFLSLVVFLYYKRDRGTKKSLLYLSALLILPIAVRVILHTIVSTIQPSYSGLSAEMETFIHQVTSIKFWPNFVLEIFSGLGLLPVILSYRLSDTIAFLRKNPHWVLYIFLGIVLLFGGKDKARNFLYLLPVVIVITSWLLEPLFYYPNIRAVTWLTLSLTLHYYLGYHFTPMDSPLEFYYRMIPVHASGPLLPNFIRAGAVLLIWIGLTLYLRPFKHCTETPHTSGTA